MPDATITSTESTFGTISGTFSADQSTVTGTVTGIITGTLSGSVGVPGPAGPAGAGVPAGGTAGQYLQKTTTGVDYATDWVTLNLSAYAPLNSPVFTGDPQAPTPAFGDNDTSIATTAFVQAGLLGGTANARNLEVYVRNQSGSTIPAGSIVYISGATGNRPLITLAQANNDANSAQTMGFTKTAIANNGFGYVIVRGELENIDTSALTEGAQLYLSPTTAGTWTTTKPSAPQHLVYVGIVVRAHPTLGVILVAVQNGYELDELHDVSIASKANNNLLAYESATNLWKNKTFSALGLLTSADAASTYYLQTNPAGYITSSALTGYATQSFVTSQGYLTDAPSDGNQYARKNGAWDVVSSTSSYITSVSSPLSVSAGDLSIDLSLYATESFVTSQGYLTSATAASTYQTLAGMSSYLTTSAAASSYYPLTGNPSSFLVAADIAGKANLASPSFTGNVTITSNSTGAALFIEQAGTGNILTLHDQASDTNFVAIDQNGKVNTIPSVTGSAGFNVPHGTAPTSPVNGDIWTTTSGFFARVNGSSLQMASLGGTQTFNGANTFNSNVSIFGLTTNLGAATGTTTVSLGAGATTSGSTKTVNIGTASLAASTTSITVGSTAGTSTTTLQGSTVGVTLAADTNTTGLATTAFVVGQAGSATPLVDGTAAVGTSLRYARQDHVHPTDTSRAALASPTFTGTPAAPTAAVDTNTTQLATTAFVVGQASSTAPAATGTAAVGTSLRYARADHVHANPLPTGGSALQVLSKVDGTDYNVAWTTPSGGGGSADVQTFTTAGTATWTKPSGKTMAWVRVWAGGSGGGSGARQATTVARYGGGGGATGGYVESIIPLSLLGSTETVTVGAGGNGGASVTTDSTNGNAGTVGGDSTFSIFRSTSGNAGGAGSSSGAGIGGANFVSMFSNGLVTMGTNQSAGGSGQGSTPGTVGAHIFNAGTSGGGGGAALANVTTTMNGGSGGLKAASAPQTGTGLVSSVAGGAAGNPTTPVLPTTGTSGVARWQGGTGGGGGGYRTGVAGQAGAAGAQPGGGGGGGGASDNGFASGAGGAGGAGMVIVVCY